MGQNIAAGAVEDVRLGPGAGNIVQNDWIGSLTKVSTSISGSRIAEAKLATHHSSIGIAKPVIAHRAPLSIVIHLNSTFV